MACNMKHRLSVIVEEDVILRIQDKIRERSFRNKSHIVEYALFKLLNEDKR